MIVVGAGSVGAGSVGAGSEPAPTSTPKKFMGYPKSFANSKHFRHGTSMKPGIQRGKPFGNGIIMNTLSGLEMKSNGFENISITTHVIIKSCPCRGGLETRPYKDNCIYFLITNFLVITLSPFLMTIV